MCVSKNISIRKILELKYIFQTHHHLDHIGGSEELIKEWPKAKVIAPLKEKRRIPFQDISVRDGDKIKILNKSFQIIELIGHTSSHIAFFSKDFNNPILFVGDTLFSAGCGRIFEGTHQEMYDSLKKISEEGIGLFVLINYKDAKSYWLNKLEEKEIEPKSNRRVIGVGSQILRALDLKKITVLGTPTKYNAVSGFDIEITGFVNE